MVRHRAKVTIDNLSEVIYEKSEINWYKRNALDLCLDTVVRLWQPLRQIRRWISWKPL